MFSRGLLAGELPCNWASGRFPNQPRGQSMRLSKAFIPIGALTLAVGLAGSVAQAADRDGHDRGGHQNQSHAQQRSNDQGGHEQRGVAERAQRENNNARVQRENNFRAESNAHVERRDNFTRRDDRAVRGYAVPRGRVEVVRPRIQVVRPRFEHHYGPSFSVFFGAGSGFRYGVPYYGRVYGYVPAPVYGAPIS